MTPAAPAIAEARPVDTAAMLGLPEHPDRAAAIGEAHARPSLPVDIPATIHHLAISTPDAEADTVLYRSLFDDSAAAAVPRHRILRRGALTVKWERHTEFVSIVMMSHGESRGGDELIARIRSVFPQGASLLVALRVRVVRERTAPVIEDAIGGVLRGGIEVTSTFHVGPAGFIDFEVVAGNIGREQLGRRLQRVLDAEMYRTMALVGLPLARRIGPELSALEGGLTEVTEMLSTGVASDDAILERLQSLSAQTEAMRARTRFRFSASRAYAALVEERLESLGEKKVGERPTLTGFTRTRLAPAIRTILSAEDRQAELSTSLGRALNLLRARVDVAMNAGNQEILSSMNDRQHRQLIISEAVESLSVIAISYYLLGILSYPVSALRDGGVLPVSSTLALGILAPFVALFVFGALRALRRRWLETPD